MYNMKKRQSNTNIKKGVNIGSRHIKSGLRRNSKHLSKVRKGRLRRIAIQAPTNELKMISNSKIGNSNKDYGTKHQKMACKEHDLFSKFDELGYIDVDVTCQNFGVFNIGYCYENKHSEHKYGRKLPLNSEKYILWMDDIKKSLLEWYCFTPGINSVLKMIKDYMKISLMAGAMTKKHTVSYLFYTYMLFISSTISNVF